jgi:hypothetical protein
MSTIFLDQPTISLEKPTPNSCRFHMNIAIHDATRKQIEPTVNGVHTTHIVRVQSPWWHSCSAYLQAEQAKS